jgi:hypothetical protein
MASWKWDEAALAFDFLYKEMERLILNQTTGSLFQEERITAAIASRSTKKIPRIGDDEICTSPMYAASDTVAKTIDTSTAQIDKSREPEPLGCPFHTVRRT